MEKEYKKLTPEQFGDIARKLPEIRSQVKEMADLARAHPERLKELISDFSSWAEIYELPFVEQLAYLFILIGIHKHIIEASETDDPYESAIEMMEEGSLLDQWFETNEEQIDKKHLLWMVMVLQRNVLSIMLTHQSLGALVAQVREGSDEAFFKAVSIDRAILTCPTFATRLAKAELTNDKPFFLHLRKAIKGPSKKHMLTIGDIRYGIVMLREAGFDSFTDDQLIRFFVGTRLYPNHHNAAKNLRKHIHAAKKFSNT